MNAWDTRQRATWRLVAEHIEVAERERLHAIEDAFQRFHLLDPFLARLALNAFVDCQLAAECMAYPHSALMGRSAYSALAVGRRDLVAEWLRTRIAGSHAAQPEPCEKE